MSPDRPETYDEANARMSRSLGERAEGSIRGMGDENDVDPVASAQGVTVGDITFRSEPPDAIQFIPGAGKTVTLRVRQVAAEGGGSDAASESPDDPFQPTPVEGSAAVTFEPGIIMSGGASISPTVGGGSTMATVPRPQLTITTSGVIYLEATLDGAGNATAIDTKNAATTPTSTTTIKRARIADVTLAGTVVTVTARYFRESRTLYLCNGNPIWDA